MVERFVDTSGWAAWTDSHEQYHALAVMAFDEVWRQTGHLVTTNWIFAELTALLTSPLRIPKSRQIQLLDDIRGDPGVLIIPIDAAVEAERP
jgi:hypothetical protein